MKTTDAEKTIAQIAQAFDLATKITNLFPEYDYASVMLAIAVVADDLKKHSPGPWEDMQNILFEIKKLEHDREKNKGADDAKIK